MERHGRDARLALITGRQAGAFSYGQAQRAGFPRSTIAHRLSTGAWERVHAGVYVHAGAPTAQLGSLWAAVLAVGEAAVITHETAALLHGAERLPAAPITMTNPHGAHHRLTGVTVHQIDDLVPAHRTRVQGIPVSTPARAVVELGATCSAEQVGLVADDLVRLRRTSYGAIAGVLAQLSRPGKPGIETVAAVLDERGEGFVPAHSELERAMFSALEAGGLPAPVRQLPLPGRGPISGIADGGYPDAQIVLEADGRRWHDRVQSSRRDRERDAQVVRAGWVPLRFVYEQIVGDPVGLCAVVEETRAMRLLQLGRVA